MSADRNSSARPVRNRSQALAVGSGAKRRSKRDRARRGASRAAIRSGVVAGIDGTIALIDGERVQVERRFVASHGDRNADVLLLRSREAPGVARTPYVRAMQLRTFKRLARVRPPHRHRTSPEEFPQT